MSDTARRFRHSTHEQQAVERERATGQHDESCPECHDLGHDPCNASERCLMCHRRNVASAEEQIAFVADALEAVIEPAENFIKRYAA